ncbi:hypothetical protein BO71DRAFT_483400 [Aspergillus ellipticus CBS 707.79]|uniref:Uncharacterized protein n=1 Tax=Aspergillus ellipticus CBS 707.79 TaxID=1448320 RepID=A0A319DLG9_9EURO|nr:hypothetical protein BO71DRAFT_483400 [Aspergillus ellipticus CBS 707.79]
MASSKKEDKAEPSAPLDASARPELDEKDELIRTLKSKLCRCEEWIKGKEEVFEEIDIRLGTFMAWIATDPSAWGKRLQGFWSAFRQTARGDGYESGADLDCLSREQKQLVLAKLDGYYKPGLEWDELVSRLSPNARSLLPRWLITAMIFKDMADRFWTNPFWYLEDEQDGPTSTSLPAQLQSLHQEFMKVDVRQGCLWRRTTTRLSAALKRQTDYTEFGEKNRARGQELARKWASELLADKTFQCLLKPGERRDAEYRLYEITGFYQEAASLAIDISFHGYYVEFQDLRALQPLVYHHKSDKLSLCGACRADRTSGGGREDGLDGREVLMIERPVMYRAGGTLELRHEVIGKAYVWVEGDPTDPDKDEQAQPVDSTEGF